MGHVSVPFRHAPGGAVFFQKLRDAVPIRKVVVLRSLADFGNRTSGGGGGGGADCDRSSALDLHMAA